MISVKKCACFLIVIVALAGEIRAQPPNTPDIANADLRQELLKRVGQDQAVRAELIKKGMQHPDEAVLARMQTIDSDNTAYLKAVVAQYGWPSPDLVGKDGVEAAFLLVQHADHADRDFQKKMLPLVQEAYRAHKLPGEDYALLLDRLRIADGRPQVYGTQAKPIERWKGNDPVLEPIEDEANVDKRRAEVGLQPLAEYVKFLKQIYFPNDRVK